MKTTALAKQLVALCRKAQWETAQKKFFAKDAVSIESDADAATDKKTKGRSAIIKKGRGFGAMLEKMHSLKVSDPVVADNAFACIMSVDMTMKGQGRVKLSELCVYRVKRGKIVSEQFYY